MILLIWEKATEANQHIQNLLPKMKELIESHDSTLSQLAEEKEKAEEASKRSQELELKMVRFLN